MQIRISESESRYAAYLAKKGAYDHFQEFKKSSV